MTSSYFRTLLVLTALGLATLFVSTPAAAGEKQQGNMVSPLGGWNRDYCQTGYVTAPASGAFVPGTSKATFKFDNKCKGQIKLSKLSGLTIGDGIAGSGDEVICLINFQTAGACAGFILRGEVAGSAATQKVKIKFDGAAETANFCPGGPGGLSGDHAHITSVECYAPDAAYGAAGACVAAGQVFFIPFASDASQGFCLAVPSYVPNPATPVLAVQGVVF
jgi:hypothetical protein